MKRTVLVGVLGVVTSLLAVPSASADGCRPRLGAVSLERSTVLGGVPVQGKVNLTCRPAKAVTVELDGFRGARVPATVVVLAHQRSAEFVVTTVGSRVTRRGLITATLRRAERTTSLTVKRNTCKPTLASIAVPAHLHAGDAAAAVARLTCIPGRASTMSLSSSHASFTVPAGIAVRSGSAKVKLPVQAKRLSGGRYQATLTATYAGKNASGVVTVDPTITVLEVPPTTSGAYTFSFSVSLSGPAPEGGLEVALASDDAVVGLGAVLKIPQGAYGLSTWTTHAETVDEDTPATLTARLGSTTLSDDVTVLRPFDDSQDPVTVSLQNGGPLYGLEDFIQVDVGIGRPAPASGLPVTVSVKDDDPSVVLDVATNESITEGSDSTAFWIDTTDVTQTKHVQIEVMVGEAKGVLALTIHPRISAITLPETAPGGTPFLGTVTLAGPSEVDTSIWLQSSWGIVDVETPLVIPAGQTSKTFTLTPSTVDEDSQVFITGYLGNTYFQSDTVTMTPVP